MGWVFNIGGYMQFSDLKGKTLIDIKQTDDELLFITEDSAYALYHYQDCCEDVHIESIVGDLDDLIGTPLLMAEEVSNEDETGNYESATWTFYKLATLKG